MEYAQCIISWNYRLCREKRFSKTRRILYDHLPFRAHFSAFNSTCSIELRKYLDQNFAREFLKESKFERNACLLREIGQLTLSHTFSYSLTLIGHCTSSDWESDTKLCLLGVFLERPVQSEIRPIMAEIMPRWFFAFRSRLKRLNEMKLNRYKAYTDPLNSFRKSNPLNFLADGKLFFLVKGAIRKWLTSIWNDIMKEHCVWLPREREKEREDYVMDEKEWDWDKGDVRTQNSRE